MVSFSEKEENFGSLVSIYQGTSICLLLSQLCLETLRTLILEKYYCSDHRRFLYDPILLLKLAIVRNSIGLN